MSKQPGMDSNKKKNKYGVITIVRKIFPDSMKVSPKLMVLYILLTVAHGTSFAVVIMAQNWFFDDAAKLMANEISIGAALLSLLLMGAIYIMNQVLNGVGNFVPQVIIGKVSGYLGAKIHRKIAKLPPITFEDTEKLDDINKAEQGKNNAIHFTQTFMDIFLFYVPYFGLMSFYLYSLKPILAVSIILVFIPTVATQIIRSKVFEGAEDQSAPIRREYDYYEECMVSRDYFKETRLLGGFHFFRRKYMEALRALQKIRYKATMKTGFVEIGMTTLTIMGYSGILYLLFRSLMDGDITVGSFAAVYGSIGWMYGIMEEVAIHRVSNMARDIGTIRNYLNFLELEEETGKEAELPKNADIVLENVSFSYPKAEQTSVKNASFTIKAGETVAIVGENGSGKSTLIRLITGLYSPIEGRVTYDGEDISTRDRRTLFEFTSAVFQKYQRYQMTLEENIGISSVDRQPQRDNLDHICTLAGVEHSNKELFPREFGTMLSKEFDGVDLSGGQWQRIAIARSFFKDHDLIILDEPTAAIDPYEETRIYNQFAEISKDKTAIIVTHRLGSVKLADKVIVMKAGVVVQIGSHEELIRQKGEYVRLYESQQQWYVEKAEKAEKALA